MPIPRVFRDSGISDDLVSMVQTMAEFRRGAHPPDAVDALARKPVQRPDAGATSDVDTTECRYCGGAQKDRYAL